MCPLAGGAATAVLLSLSLAACGGDSAGTTSSPAAGAARTTTFSLDDPAYQKAIQAKKDAAAALTGTTPAPPAPATETAAVPPPAAGPPRPRIVQRPIPFGARRREEMAAYSVRHYGAGGSRLKNPRVIVEHFTESPDFSSAYNTFAPDVADPELHELPGLCAHFVVDKDGTIYQLVPLRLRCRHTVGLNWTAIGIEQVGSSDREILDRPGQLKAVLRLTEWLQCRFGISTKNVIGHNESLRSPYHHENVAALRSQTHDDWQKADMDIVRARLRGHGCS